MTQNTTKRGESFWRDASVSDPAAMQVLLVLNPQSSADDIVAALKEKAGRMRLLLSAEATNPRLQTGQKMASDLGNPTTTD